MIHGPGISADEGCGAIQLVGAIYKIGKGQVRFLDQPSVRRDSQHGLLTLAGFQHFHEEQMTINIAIIGFQSPLFQDLWHQLDASMEAMILSAHGATLIGVTSLFNGAGRITPGPMPDDTPSSRPADSC